MKHVALNRVGSIDLVDLQAISDSTGRDFLPFPFAQLRPTRFASFQEYASHAAAAPERLRHGDLRDFHLWFTTYLNADIRVESVVSIVGAPRGRILAHRCGQSGFIAAQRSEDHVIDIYAVPPFDLGPAITSALALTGPGRHPKIVIPEFVRTKSRGDDSREVSVRSTEASSDALSVPRSKVLRYTRIQSRWQPARDWGFDRSKDVLVYVAIGDDGDYIYSPKFVYLTPMTAGNLSERIDQLIADDIARLRAQRKP
ncbi:ESX secretion-associated protein EspG [Mycobacterium camsae]|uniref:ESX secretion-associated protein EspG n=1 Tax=Mycobacterium gordonae TaxID=1778 RepID=UPI00197D8262|nr:ESX secretion-associated protein EspG [Mycobacterium gordonae]